MSIMQALVFGADGGGTKTAGLLADTAGAALARVHLGASNPNVVGIDQSARNLADLIRQCCTEAGRAPSEVGALVFGLAGTGSPAIRDRLLDAVRAELSSTFTDLPPIMIETDARIALEGAFGGGPGVILIAGTGSIVLGKRADGEIVRVGGWGRVLGDEGSGYYVGLEALKAVSKDLDGLSEATLLKELFAARLGWTSRQQIILAVYQEDFAIPSLAPLVLQAAEKGDPVSLGILRTASSHVGEQIAATTKRIDDTHKVRVVFVGGLIDHDTVYSAILRDTILNAIPGVEICPPERTPVEGAVLMAQQLLTTEM
ncbi:MAG: hypothetical protein KAJ12_07275 [Bacteroidetes bacterium]|nr:hypothetical protein [Bacteroidota bacterium]